MRFMNDYDIDNALRAFLDRAGLGEGETPHLGILAVVVNNLADWANDNSDGWAYWPKPCRAAARAQEILQDALSAQYRGPVEDIDIPTLRKACAPIKAFLTRQGVDHSEVFQGRLGILL